MGELLQQELSNSAARHLSGIVMSQLSESQPVLEHFDLALRRSPGVAAIQYNRGNAFTALRRFADAVAAHAGAIGGLTSITHVAGATDRSVWLERNTLPNWRGTLGCSDSTRYPTVHLFWQDRIGDWPGVFQAMADSLQLLVPGRLAVRDA